MWRKLLWDSILDCGRLVRTLCFRPHFDHTCFSRYLSWIFTRSKQKLFSGIFKRLTKLLSNVWQRCYPTFDKGVIQRLIKLFSNVVNRSFQRWKQVFSNIRNKYFQILGTGVVAISLLRCLNSHHLNNNKRMVVDGWSIGGRKSTQRTIDHHYKRLIYR